jgi:hypothetical protein
MSVQGFSPDRQGSPSTSLVAHVTAHPLSRPNWCWATWIPDAVSTAKGTSLKGVTKSGGRERVRICYGRLFSLRWQRSGVSVESRSNA